MSSSHTLPYPNLDFICIVLNQEEAKTKNNKKPKTKNKVLYCLVSCFVFFFALSLILFSGLKYELNNRTQGIETGGVKKEVMGCVQYPLKTRLQNKEQVCLLSVWRGKIKINSCSRACISVAEFSWFRLHVAKARKKEKERE